MCCFQAHGRGSCPRKSCTVVTGCMRGSTAVGILARCAGAALLTGARRRGSRHGQPACWPPRPAFRDAELTPARGPLRAGPGTLLRARPIASRCLRARMSASVPSPVIDQILLELTQPIGPEDPVPALRHLAREQMTYSCDCAMRRRGRPSNRDHPITDPDWSRWYVDQTKHRALATGDPAAAPAWRLSPDS